MKTGGFCFFQYKTTTFTINGVGWVNYIFFECTEYWKLEATGNRKDT